MMMVGHRMARVHVLTTACAPSESTMRRPRSPASLADRVIVKESVGAVALHGSASIATMKAVSATSSMVVSGMGATIYAGSSAPSRGSGALGRGRQELPVAGAKGLSSAPPLTPPSGFADNRALPSLPRWRNW